ncbi:phosphoglycerate mutase family protein [Mobiluncus curtisii ATCC 51333]|uniref:Phosphoglycerate mutase family protein n=1 Tax=Mobiluncus curtisii ATCC 51333 TaxID=887326 RepID=E6LYX9_9ACTO|nr:phosphoglycerate mutase family protein [Mobiluncus curtisii ATCC 51333]
MGWAQKGITLRLVLIRHGETDSNLSGALDTAWPGRPLNATGREQAVALVDKFHKLVGSSPQRLACSFILRTRQTAEPLAQAFNIPVQVDPDLREVRAGALEMSTTLEDTREYLDTAIGWVTGDLERRMPGAESGAETLARFDRGIARLCAGLEDDPEATVAVVIHGAIMRVWGANRIEGLTLDLLAQFPCQNCSLTLATGSPTAGWKAELWSDRHLEDWPVVPGGKPRTSKEAREHLESVLLS